MSRDTTGRAAPRCRRWRPKRWARPSTVKSFVQEPEQSRHYSCARRGQLRRRSDAAAACRAALIGARDVRRRRRPLVVPGLVGRQMRCSKGQVTAGELTQFMIYALMAHQRAAAMSDVCGTIQTVAGATERLIEILDTNGPPSGRRHPVAAAPAAAGHGGVRATSPSPTTTRDNERRAATT